jgi:DNA-binding NarL/FixJ family response regulator
LVAFHEFPPSLAHGIHFVPLGQSSLQTSHIASPWPEVVSQARKVQPVSVFVSVSLPAAVSVAAVSALVDELGSVELALSVALFVVLGSAALVVIVSPLPSSLRQPPPRRSAAASESVWRGVEEILRGVMVFVSGEIVWSSCWRRADGLSMVAAIRGGGGRGVGRGRLLACGCMSESDAPLRVILAEDHTIVREGLRALLSARSDMSVVAEVGDGQAAVEAAARLRPDVIVMDLGMPLLNGVDATAQIREQAPGTQVLILSMHSSEAYVRPAIRAGAGGYLVKGSGLSDLVAAIQALGRGEAFFSPAVAKILLQESRRPEGAQASAPAGDNLTNREREVLRLVAEGRSSPEIAELLSLSVKTVEGHRGRIMAKLEATNVVGLVRHAIKIGLVSADE